MVGLGLGTRHSRGPRSGQTPRFALHGGTVTARALSAAERQRLYAPKLSAALNREGPHMQEAAAALNGARAFVAQVNELQMDEGTIVRIRLLCQSGRGP